MKMHYFIIPLITILVMVLGSYFSSEGMQWYAAINRPDITPPRWVFPVVWNIIFLLTTIAVFFVVKQCASEARYTQILTLFVVNALLNVAWSYFFFYNHMIGAALVDAILLALSLYALMWLIIGCSPTAALLIAPYTLWTTFAVYLNWLIWRLN